MVNSFCARWVLSQGHYMGFSRNISISMRIDIIYICINGGFNQWGYPFKWMVNHRNPTKIDDLGVPLFQETSISIQCLIDGGILSHEAKAKSTTRPLQSSPTVVTLGTHLMGLRLPTEYSR